MSVDAASCLLGLIVGTPYTSNYGKKQHRKGDDSNDPKYSSSGSIEQPILVMGQLSYAQTYTGTG